MAAAAQLQQGVDAQQDYSALGPDVTGRSGELDECGQRWGGIERRWVASPSQGATGAAGYPKGQGHAVHGLDHARMGVGDAGLALVGRPPSAAAGRWVK